MAGEAVVVPAQFLINRQDQWNGGYTLYGPADITAGLPDQVRRAAQVIVCGGSHLDPALIDELPAVQLVACFSTGFEGIDHLLLASRGIAFTTASGINAHDVADHAMALFLARWHGIIPADRVVREGTWAGFRQEMAARRSLRGRHAGIVGLGRIGEAIAARAAAHGMDVRWWGPRPKPTAAWQQVPAIEDLAAWADVLFIAARSAPENTGLIGSATLAALGPEGVVVNVARGSLIDEDAMIAALAENLLGGASLDVFEDEPTDPARWTPLGDKVVLAPHTAGYTQEAGRDMFGQLRENLRRHFAGEPLLTPFAGLRSAPRRQVS